MSINIFKGQKATPSKTNIIDGILCFNISHYSSSGARPWVANIVLIVDFPQLKSPTPTPPAPLSQSPVLSSREKKFILEKTLNNTLCAPILVLLQVPPPDYYLLSELTRIHVVLFIFVTHSVDCDYHCKQMYYRKSLRLIKWKISVFFGPPHILQFLNQSGDRPVFKNQNNN